MTSLLILPNQLFDIKYFPKDKEISKVVLYEHPQYFTKYNFNKKKLVLHRASMKYYSNYLTKKKFVIEYLNFNQALKIGNIGALCFQNFLSNLAQSFNIAPPYNVIHEIHKNVV